MACSQLLGVSAAAACGPACLGTQGRARPAPAHALGPSASTASPILRSGRSCPAAPWGSTRLTNLHSARPRTPTEDVTVPVNSPQVVNSEDVFWKCNLGYPHTSHCLGSGEIMISALGDPAGNGKGTPVPTSLPGRGCWDRRDSPHTQSCPGGFVQDSQPIQQPGLQRADPPVAACFITRTLFVWMIASLPMWFRFCISWLYSAGRRDLRNQGELGERGQDAPNGL